MSAYGRGFALWLLLALGSQADAMAQGIYTCIDAKGRRLTSDRPIIECLDREQRELTGTGTVKRVLKPALSADEAAIEEEKQRKAAEERQRVVEEKRRERLLVARYPDQATHDRERAQALMAVESVIAAANRRVAELEEQRAKLHAETEFYKGDRSRMPAILHRQIDTNENTIAAQKRFIDNQFLEKQRTNTRFDEELAKLKVLWGEQQRAAAAAASATNPATAKP